LFLPLTTEHKVKCEPVANLMLIALTVLVSWSLFDNMNATDGDRGVLNSLVLSHARFRPSQLVGTIFVHANPVHLIGNMALLLVIGNPVNRRLGNLRYLGLYLVMGVIAALAWLAFAQSSRSLVGASGAIMGMVGMFLVLFPTNRIKGVLSWLSLGVLCLVGFWVAFDLTFGTNFVMATGVLYAGGLVFFATHRSPYSDTSAGNLLLTVFGLRIVHLTGIWLVLLTFGFDVIYLLVQAPDGVAHVAHVAGAVSGFVLAVDLCMSGKVGGNSDEPTLVELVRPAVAEPQRPTGTSRRYMTFEDWHRVHGVARRTRTARRKQRPSQAA
jgi:membrane associated rhomboid family serine protease